MTLNELMAGYMQGLVVTALVLACLILVTGLDDLFIDVVYWGRRVLRVHNGRQEPAPPDAAALRRRPEKPLVIMVPAWQEYGVIDQMAELATRTLEYGRYHIFLGTYPNDPKTQADADRVCAKFPHIHKVVCARPGPTSKADCLNNILSEILRFEQREGFLFEGFILHDAEDVLSRLELRLFNWMVGPYDLVQVPVYPLVRSWRDFTSGHYLDEFAETHGKDLVVREALARQVPSAGVGSCFSRRAIGVLLREGQGQAFDEETLTEDYDISVRLKLHGLKEVFMRSPLSDTRSRRAKVGTIAVREYFPDTLNTAVRQKSRWIIGIVFQGFKRHRWTADPVLNYFLWRDRKGVIVNLLGFLTTVLTLQLLVLWLLGIDDWQRLPVARAGGSMGWLPILLAINLVLIVNRLAQRAIFVTESYGLAQGLLSAPRMIWGNLVNFLATCRAISQVRRFGARHVAWDKTRHDFPTLAPAPAPGPSAAPLRVLSGSAPEAGAGRAAPGGAKRRPTLRVVGQERPAGGPQAHAAFAPGAMPAGDDVGKNPPPLAGPGGSRADAGPAWPPVLGGGAAAAARWDRLR